jgi:prolyl oligopeptidase
MPPNIRAVACAAIAIHLMAMAPPKLNYPATRTGAQTDIYHGQKIADPYRWLEDTNSPETKAWVEEENKVTQAWLAQVPEREAIKARLTELYNYERYTNAFSWGGRYFLFRNDGLQNQAVLYIVTSKGDNEKLLFDPNKLRADGTAALCGTSVSHDGKLLGYAVSQAGSDWCEWRIRDIETGTDRDDLVQWTKFTTLRWTPDSRAFYYTRYPQPAEKDLLTAQNRNAKIYLHKLGQPQSSDQLVYEDPEHPTRFISSNLTPDGRCLVVTLGIAETGKSMIGYLNLTAANGSFIVLTPDTDHYNYVGSVGRVLYLQTTAGGPKGRIIAIDLDHPKQADWKEIVPEQPNAMDDANLADGKLVVSYLKDAHAYAEVYSLDGKRIAEVKLPGLGTATWAAAEESATELFYTFTTFTAPNAIYRFDVRTAKSTLIRRSRVNFDPDLYETKQIFFKSKDGTHVPMFLVHRKGLKLDGNNPTILYGYGGFQISITPTFSANQIAWMEKGGLYAVANLRGGSEYGEDWHLAGTKLKKQNVFDDFIAAAEWLIANKYTSTSKLAIQGGSNGGLLVGACLNQRPDLFGAALPAVGVMDMLRFQKFTAGLGWVGDYGSSDNAEEFKALVAYSPLHNIRKGTHYPPTFITTSDHDDRVVPGHSFKYAAALQAAQGGDAPILIRIETRAGHGAGKPTTKIIEEAADRLAFLGKVLH